VIIDNYPTNLIIEDRWGATPLLYAIWGDAPIHRIGEKRRLAVVGNEFAACGPIEGVLRTTGCQR
jgi:hypothetical protein